MDVENDEDDVWYQKFVDSGKKYTVMLGEMKNIGPVADLY